MYLIELSANKPSFQTIKFKDGLNFIIGGKSNEQKNNKNIFISTRFAGRNQRK